MEENMDLTSEELCILITLVNNELMETGDNIGLCERRKAEDLGNCDDYNSMIEHYKKNMKELNILFNKLKKTYADKTRCLHN